MTLLQRAALIGVIGLASWGAHATDGDFVWARSMGGPDYDSGNGIAVDGAGNVYTTGYFEGTVDFDPGAGTFNLTSAGTTDIFVQKLDASGNLVWARRMGGAGDDEGNGIAVDGAGNVYTTGSFEGTADFDPGPDTLNIASAGFEDIFVQKLDASGNLVWVRSMGGRGYRLDFHFGRSIAVDGAGNVHTTGSFHGTVDFDPGPGAVNLASAGSSDIFVQKLDTSGNLVWARSMGGYGVDIGRGIAVDGVGSVYTTGSFQRTADFDPGAGTMNLTSEGFDDIFVQKLDASGNLVWARRMGGTDSEGGYGIAVDGAGNVYTTGSFAVTVDFDPGVGTVNLTSAGLRDIFVQKLDASGNLAWARRMGGSRLDNGYGIAVDGAGNVYTTGGFVGTVDFDPGAGAVYLRGAGIYDIFVQKLDPSGNLVWARRMGGTDSEGGYGIAVDSARNVYTTGYFRGTVDFDPRTGTVNLAPNGDQAIFVQKLGPDVVPPKATGIVLRTQGPTNLGSVGFTVTFDEEVKNFDAAADLVIAHSGTTNSGVMFYGGPRNYTVTTTGVSGDGSFTLAVNTSSDVQDDFGNPLATSVTSAAALIDNTPPTVILGAPSISHANLSTTVKFPVAVTGANRINLTSGDVTVNHSGAAGGSVVVVDGTSETPVIEVSGVAGDGSYSISVSAGIASDAAGNSSEATGPGNAVTVDNTPPAFTNIASIPPEVEAGNPVLLTFDSTEPLSGDPEVTVNGNPATLSRKAAYGYTYVALESDAPGPARIEIQGMDIAGNLGSATDTSVLSIVEPTPEGEGDVEGSVEGATEGGGEGSLEGELEGMPEGTAEGAVEGGEEGAIEGSLEGQEEGEEEGTTEGSAEGLDEGEAEGSAEGAVEGSIEGMIEGEPEGAIEGSEEGSMDGEGEGKPGGGLLSCRCNAFGPSPSLGEILGQLFLGALTLMALLMMTVYQKRFW